MSYSNEYMHVEMEYVSKWVEATTVKTVDPKTVIKFLKKNILCRFGLLKVLIRNGGTHFLQ